MLVTSSLELWLRKMMSIFTMWMITLETAQVSPIIELMLVNEGKTLNHLPVIGEACTPKRPKRGEGGELNHWIDYSD